MSVLSGPRRGWPGRGFRWLRTRLGLGARIHWVCSELYSAESPPSAHDSRRADRILDHLHDEGLLRPDRLHRPRPASLRILRLVHDDEYLESLQDVDVMTSILGGEWPDPVRILDNHRAMVGGTVLASRIAIREREISVNLGGGFHHARADRGQGFCIFNDVAVAIADLRARGFRERVCVIDLDLHDGDGTRAIFAADADVYTLSIHNRDLGPSAAVASTCLALGTDVRDEAYLESVREHVPVALARSRPGMIFYLAGVDPAADDAIGDWRISAEAMLERDRTVVRAVRALPGNPGLAILLAGGYGRYAWRYSARFFGWLAGGRAIEPRDSDRLRLARYRRLARRVHATDLTHEPVTEWTLTEQDLVGDLNPAAATTRLLGYYTKHGVELALERLGFFDRLRERGYQGLEVRIDVASRLGQTVRIVSPDNPREPLVELRARRDATTVRGLELLRVEWLELQDPRRSFSRDRPRLPGQKHPGLGLLRDVVALLVLVCERLGLDGIVFTPSHYHLAVQSRRHLRFLDPAVEARFRAVLRALHAHPLAEATRAVDEGRVIDEHSGEVFTWIPAPMVIPVTERLRSLVQSEEYERAVAAHTTDTSFRLQRVVDREAAPPS